jgi:four helix bundle protein
MDFEDLFLFEEGGKPYNIRHRAFHFSKELVLFIKNASYDRIFFSMFDQLLRAGTSIGANLVEARAGSSRKDWRNYYAIGLKSANETKYWICLIRDTLDLDKSKLNELLKEADELSKIIASIIVSE